MFRPDGCTRLIAGFDFVGRIPCVRSAREIYSVLSILSLIHFSFLSSFFIERKMISVEARDFNSLMGSLEVPYRYHKTLHNAGRSQIAPSADLTNWLPVENADDVWRQVRTLFNTSSGHRISVGGPQRSVAPPAGPGIAVSDLDTHSNPKIKPTPLPDEHPTHMLQESRQYYRSIPEGESIPFLVSKRKKEKIRTVVLATSDKKRPDVPVKVQIYLREWDTQFAFWTMDINNKRWIVKNTSGAPNGGCKYNYWAGPNRGLDGPIAFSDNSVLGSFRKAPYTDYIEIDSDADDLQEEEITDGTRSGQYFKEESEIPDLFTALQAESTRRNAAQENLDSIISWPFPDDEDERPIKVEQAGLDGPENVSNHTSPPVGHPEDAPGTARYAQTLAAKRRRTDTISDSVDRVDEGSPGPNAQLMATLAARPSRSILSEEAAAAPRPHISQMNVASGSPVSTPPALSLEKQEKTLLQIRLEQDGFNRVKKFRSCFTISQFFTLVADARKIPADDLERAEVTIDAAQDNQRPYKIELMPDDDEEYMEALIGKIDAWPLEKGLCNVDVVLYRHGQVSIAISMV